MTWCLLIRYCGNSYAEHVLSSKSLPNNYETDITMQQLVAGDHISVNVSRAVSNFKQDFDLLAAMIILLLTKNRKPVLFS